MINKSVSFNDALHTWIKIALLSFGGPAGQISVMHRILVDEKKWLSDARFMHALNYCMILPGPEAQQLATYIGWLLHGVKGGLVAGGLFILPGFLSILLLSFIYVAFAELSLVEGFFFGLKVAVLAVVIQAAIKISNKVLKTKIMWYVGLTAFLAIFLFNISFPVIILGAALLGFFGGKIYPNQFYVIKAHSIEQSDLENDTIHSLKAMSRNTLKTIVIWSSLWFVPLLLIMYFLGMDHVFSQLAIFFSKLAVVTFGGAYAVLAYMAQQAVEVFSWLKPGEMLDGLGMAETTPGPLIQVVQFVGFMGSFRAESGLNPYMAGLIGSLLVTWMTFVPCFLWIFAGAPYIEKLRKIKIINAMLSTVTAAVTGVVLNLAIWFAIHVLFNNVMTINILGLSNIKWPVLMSIDWLALMMFLFSAWLLFKTNLGMIMTILFVSGLMMLQAFIFH